ncbi:DUF551 domain-containing protein [Cronobacter sakazakii]
MSTISTEQAKDLRNAFECWQQDYDPVEDKEQYEMFGLGVVAMDELLALRKEREKAEPVAWMLTDNEFGHSVATKAGFTLNFYRSKGWGVTPLYTAPPAPVVPEWIACSERLPEVGDIVLTADNGCVNVGEMERSGASYGYFTSVVSGRELPATHWMPLPAAPGKEG